MPAGDQPCLQHSTEQQCELTWNVYNACMVHRWETEILRLTFRPKMQPGGEWVACSASTARMLRTRWKKLGVPSLAELCAEKVWKMMAWAVCDGEVPVLKALRFVTGWRKTAWGRNRSAWGMKWDPLNITCWKHKWGFHNRGVTWDTPMARWAGLGRRLDTEVENESSQEDRSGSCTGTGNSFVTVTDQNDRRRHSS